MDVRSVELNTIMGRSVLRASPAPPYLKRGSHKKPPSPPSLALRPSYSQIVKTKTPPHDPVKLACDHRRVSHDQSRDISHDPPILSRSHDQPHNPTQSCAPTQSHDHPHFGRATHPLIGMWKTMGAKQRSTRSQGILQRISHSLSPMDTGTGNAVTSLRA